MCIRDREIRFNKQCETLLAMYDAMEHPEVNNYKLTVNVNCCASKFVDGVFDVMLRNNAQDVSVISDESVTECVHEQTCVSLQNDDGNCNDDEIMGLDAPVMAEAGAATALAPPLQTKLPAIDFDNSGGLPEVMGFDVRAQAATVTEQIAAVSDCPTSVINSDDLTDAVETGRCDVAGRADGQPTPVRDSNEAITATMPVVKDDTGKQLPEPLHCCLLYTSPSPRDGLLSRMPSSA